MNTPEIGQMIFSNGAFREHPVPHYVENGLVVIAEAVAAYRGEDPEREGILISNFGCDPFESETFSMRTYCWCEGDRDGHEDGCPPNFEHPASGLTVGWYKHVGRGATQNMPIDPRAWMAVMQDCLDSLEVTE